MLLLFLSAFLAGGSQIVPDVGHGVWSRAYEDPEFAAWLFAERRSVRRPTSRRPTAPRLESLTPPDPGYRFQAFANGAI